ncbi:MAG TPA: zinc ABC transporter substrate-binding protein, partial [Acidimicrobiaceae bacterium]|nr:zinc ABC transporter substrate-binding protein [Acidimicrobiaceae bacterium]
MIVSLFASACGNDEGSLEAKRPTVVVTTNILGDVVRNLVGDELEVITIMPVGANPHDFQASAKQVAEISKAAALVVNGADFEEGLLDVIDSASVNGVRVFEAISAVKQLDYNKNDHDDHADHADHA